MSWDKQPEIFMRVTLPCGCVLENKLRDTRAITTELRAKFLRLGLQRLSYWVEVMAAKHECPLP